MILPSDKEYTQTKRIILGTTKMKPEFIPLAEWIDKTFNVKTVNIIYDKLDDKTPRIEVCFEFEKEKQKFLSNDTTYFDKKKQKAIGEKFKETITNQGLSKSKKSFFSMFNTIQNGQYLTENVFVVYGAFEPVAKQETIYKISTSEKEAFQKSFNNPDIWEISIGFTIPTFFLYTDSQVKEYNTQDIKQNWADKYFDFIKPYDNFNYFKREDIYILLDSKENFDNSYESNWYYYYK